MNMLFMAVCKHTAEMCPAGIVRPDRKFATSLEEHIKKIGIDLVGGYLDGPGHEFYFLFETDDQSKLMSVLVPLMQIGDVKTVPVVKFSDVVALTRKLGIQE